MWCLAGTFPPAWSPNYVNAVVWPTVVKPASATTSTSFVIAVEADTATASAPHTLQGIEQQLRNMAEHPPNSYEVTAARQYVTGMTALAASSQQAWAGSLLLTLTLGQEPDRIAQFLEHLTGVGDDEVAAAAARFYCPDDYHGIVLGDTAALSETDIPQ